MELERGFRVGQWEVYPLKGEIVSDQSAVHLEPKVMEVLVVLAEHAEEVVLRDELLARVWGSRAATSDEPLTRCIAQLRQSLADSSRDPSYIQTVPKRGYRLMRPIGAIANGHPEPAAQAAAGRPARTVEAAGARPRQLPWIGGLAAVALVAYALGSTINGPPKSESCDLEPWYRTLFIDRDARDLCEEGLRRMADRDGNSLPIAIEFFRQAVDADPDYGSAVVMQARAMVVLPSYSSVTYACKDEETEDFFQPDCYESAFDLLEKHAMRLAYIDDYSFGVLGYIYTKQRQWGLARRSFRNAVRRTPLDADMWQWRSQYYAAVGFMDDALAAIEKAYEIDMRDGKPSAVVVDRYGFILMWLGETELARAKFAELDKMPGASGNHNGEIIMAIRDENWGGLKDLLEVHVDRRPLSDSSEWIVPFIEWLRTGDEGAQERAYAQVLSAIDDGHLRGVYAFGALVYLEKAGDAIDQAIALVRESGPERPDSFNAEFLFASEETKILRNHRRFEELVDLLEWTDHWRDEGRCPEIFERPGEEYRCEL